MEPIGGDVRRELGRFGAAGAMADVVAAWPAAVGDAVARNAWPARISRDGTLHVATSSSAWAFELGHLAATILGRLQEAVGKDAPRALRFAPGPLPELRPPASDERPPVPAPSPEEVAAGEALAAGIGDEELRALVARAAAASLARRSSGRGS